MKRENQKRNLLILLSILFLSTLSSCAGLQEIDTPFCVELGLNKGFCTTPISGRDQYVDGTNLLEGKTWWEMRPTMIMIPPSTYAALKRFIIKQCKKNPKTCNKEIPSWDRSIKKLDDKINEKN